MRSKGRAGTKAQRKSRGATFKVGDDTYCVISAPLDDAVLSLLTEAELAVAQLGSRGLSNRDIALARGTSERTVANQMAAILRKLGASSRTEAFACLCKPQESPSGEGRAPSKRRRSRNAP